jgi:hypothetical protein
MKMFFKTISAIMLSMACAGCISVEQKDLGAGSYEIMTEENLNNPHWLADSILNDRASALCAQGYRKLSEHSTPKGEAGPLVWQIECAGGK